MKSPGIGYSAHAAGERSGRPTCHDSGSGGTHARRTPYCAKTVVCPLFFRQLLWSVYIGNYQQKQHHGGMDSSHQDVLDLAVQPGLIRPRHLNERGPLAVALTRPVRQGRTHRVGRGPYAIPNRTVSEHGELARVARKHPQAPVCLLSALRVHDLTTQSPLEVWLAIPSKVRQ